VAVISRTIAFIYGLFSYAMFLIAFLYAIGFVGNVIVPKSIDSGSEGSLVYGLLVNTALLGLFAIPHSIMAREGFKRHWTKVVPEPVERSTYVLITSLLLTLLFSRWEPMRMVVWNFDTGAARVVFNGLFLGGWSIVLLSTFTINHFDLFGLRQVFLHLRGETYTPIPFKVPALYRVVRHPLMLGFIVAFWATPKMTLGHLLFATATTAYMFIGIVLEERDLLRIHGEAYARYRKRTPMIIPFLKSIVP
jgi:protein-S-isoprenylcysteine O-methyltransferase Ste14